MKIIETNLAFRSALSKRNKTNQIVLHHAAARNCSVETIHSWHLGNGWSGIGYHFFVRKDGTIYRGRPIDKVGAHCSGHNSNTIGICFEGNFQEETMDAIQIQAGQELISYLFAMYGLNEGNVVRHRDLMATSCPGTHFPYETIRKGNVAKPITPQIVNPKPDTQKTYTVIKGDTLSGIGKNLGIDWKQIASLNNIKGPLYTIKVGQVLKLSADAKVEVGYTAKVTAKSGLNMRKIANEQGNKILTIPKNTKLHISKEENGWGYTCYDNKYGWVYLYYVKKC